ncbi:MAG: SUF system NifU family Fe-S cluster assembly protein [Gemmatimonadetes bacterium]|nr:SUF system NifU family Fe-S cluster assembly protein [Gemmatimonadota bacterium]
MSSASELYQSIILDHNRSPRNFREIKDASRSAEGYNPLCGDQLRVWLKVEDDKIADVSFQGSGCAISKASASLMTTVVKGKTPAEAARIFESFHRMVTGQGGPADDLPAKLAVFAGVREFPARVKCASLAWHALRNALEQAGTDPVSTE